MHIFEPVIIAVTKEFWTRVYCWRQTIREILIPVVAVILMNLAGGFLRLGPPGRSRLMDNTVSKHCHHGGAGMRMNVTYAPGNNFTDLLMSLATCLGGFDARAGEIEQDEFMFNAGVLFRGTDSEHSAIPDSLDYEVFSGANQWLGARDLWWENTVYIRSYESGTLNKFFKLIHAVDESFLQLKNIPTPEMSFQNMEMAGGSPWMHKLFILVAFFLGFSLMVPAVAGALVQAKCSGVKELVVMAGLKRWHLWAAKLFDCVWLSGTCVLLMLIFLYVPLTKDSRVLTALPFSVLGWYLCLGLFGVFVFLCFMSCLFDSPALAAITTQVVWFASFILFLFMSMYSTEVSFSFWLICCLLPHFSFFAGLSILLDFDYYGKEFNPGEILSVDPNYPTYNDVTLMIILEMVFYFALGLYLEEVIPGKFGIPKPYNFLLKKSYWYRRKVKSEDANSAPGALGKVRDVDFEPVPDGTNVGISIRNLRKEYKSLSERPVAAVDDIDIDFYSGEISVILGHSGAGKTSLLSAISGLTHATSGQILINGYDMAENTDEARRSFGYCPQRDMLLEDLTPLDNLRFFAMAKGLGVRDAREEAYTLLDKLKLRDAERTLVRKLSRGQKRKLSLGIALVGGSDVVLLDEPTSGLDPGVRREIWEILLSFKGTILLTTRSAVEAEVLSDRIAIMDGGKIKCYGTATYLKSKYGSGYSLSVVIQDAERAQGLTQFIQTFVETAKLTRQDASTLTYQLPEEEASNFPLVFSGLDEKQDSGEIESYSVNFSSVEDSLLRSRGGNESEDGRTDTVDRSPGNRLDCSDEVHPTKVDSFVLPFLQFYALIVKKCIYFSRNIGSYLMFSAVALLFVVASFVIIPAAVRDPENGAGRPGNFTYSLDLYGKSAVPYSTASENELSRSFAEYLAKHGWETRRVGNVEKELGKLFRDNFHAYTRETLMAIEFDGDNNTVKIFHNPYAVHMLPLALNAFYDSILLGNNVSGEIKTSVNGMYSGKEENHIFSFFGSGDPGNKLPACSISDVPDFIGIQALFYLIGPMRERLFGAKHLQLMTTCGTLYWFAHLIFDCATFAIYLLVPTLTIGFSTKDDMFLQNKEEIFFGMVLCGIGLILLTYVLSSVTKSLGLASAAFLAAYLTGTFAVYYPVKWKMWARGFQYFHPSCILKIGLSSACAKEEGNHYWTALIIYSIVLFAFLVAKDCHVLRDLLHRCYSHVVRVRYEEPAQKDANVRAQEELVKGLTDSGDYSGNSLIVDGLKRWRYKEHRPSPIVNGISFAVKSGECLGLLGVNGAGKTTSFRMMTGNMAATGGRVLVNGYNLFSPVEKSRGLFEIGYCPQYGGFVPTLKGKELLALFARLRGIRESHVSREALKWAEELDLMEYADTPVENYSGGNQRKLMTGIAVVGSPRVIFLDEPTSGVDPVSRRNLWRIVNNLRAEGKSVLFTSRSMDECEAICTRLAVMVEGRFRCSGEMTTIKDIFGQGYAVRLKIRAGAATDELTEIKEAMSKEFDPGCDLIDEHLVMDGGIICTTLQYHITNGTIKWATLFSKLIRMREDFGKLESFSASAATPEGIFMSLARSKEGEGE